jgi:hypothetical protein
LLFQLPSFKVLYVLEEEVLQHGLKLVIILTGGWDYF